MNNTRRNFLLSSAAIAASTATTKAAASDRVNLGFIGIGMRGIDLFDAFKDMSDTNLLAVADVYDSRLECVKNEHANGKLWTGRDYRKILDRKDIDAVIIATPDHLHKQMVLDALDAGKDVFCEKPMTYSIDEGPILQAAVKKTDRIFQVGSQHKTSASTRKAKEIAKSGVLGKINMVRSFQHRNNAEGAWRYPIPPNASTKTIDWQRFLGNSPQMPFSAERFFRWRCWWDYSGGVASDLFVHNLTTIHEILGLTQPKSVAANGGIFRWNDGRTVPDLLNALFLYPEDILLDMCVGQTYSGPGDFARGTQFIGSEATMYVGRRFNRPTGNFQNMTPAQRRRLFGGGVIEIHPEPPSRNGDVMVIPTNSWPKAMRQEYFAANGAGPDGRLLDPPKPAGKVQEIKVEVGENDLTFHEHFIRSVKQRTPSVENVDEGANAAAAAHMANRSYREGQTIVNT